jgi:hypothetical protein
MSVMRYRLCTLLITALFGPMARGWDIWPRFFGFGSRGLCAYCRKTRQLVEVPGPIGTGDVFVCQECADACLSLIR